MIRLLQTMTENLKLSAAATTVTSISSGLIVWGVPLSELLQIIGVVVAVVSAVISALFLLAMFIEKRRSNKADEEETARSNKKQETQKDRELDIRERELKAK